MVGVEVGVGVGVLYRYPFGVAVEVLVGGITIVGVMKISGG